MPIRRFVRRSVGIVGIVVGLLLPLTIGITPARASDFRTTMRSAVASWVPTGPGTPNVSIQVTEGSGERGNSVTFSVSENYCETATNTAVYLNIYATNVETNQLFVVTRNLGTALLNMPRLSVNYSKMTAPGCNTNGVGLTTVQSGCRTISLFGLWHANGPATPTFPGNTVRPASAILVVSAPEPLKLPRLGRPVFAQITEFTSPPERSPERSPID
jgi:hypothetical protein